MMESVIKVMDHLQPAVWYIENPVGMLGSLPVMQSLAPSLLVVSQCHFGLPYRKDTCIWTSECKELAETGRTWRCARGSECVYKALTGKHQITAQGGPGANDCITGRDPSIPTGFSIYPGRPHLDGTEGLTIHHMDFQHATDVHALGRRHSRLVIGRQCMFQPPHASSCLMKSIGDKFRLEILGDMGKCLCLGAEVTYREGSVVLRQQKHIKHVVEEYNVLELVPRDPKIPVSAEQFSRIVMKHDSPQSDVPHG